ncbi:hypothetical protein BDZ94DRAFT_704738 [Collybia nuda]|uniref:Uncharacterized protein n=1 Tax=Collybia nuda TaxID=64659 RepID=A0A9P6CE94_9AGAR|nr:hypothetical protein BDZ94DRAFT_704738 [Collybia nuda]
MSFSLEVPMVMQTSPPSPIEELVSPRRSASFHVSSTPQFPPTYSPTPTSPVYTPFTASAPRLDDVFQPLQFGNLLPESKEDIRPVSWMSEASTCSTIPSPLFDSFPAVPQDSPLPINSGFSHTQGHARNASRPSLPLSVPSFFDATPLSSTPVGSEFVPNPSPFLRSATSSTLRPVTMPPQSSAEQYR